MRKSNNIKSIIEIIKKIKNNPKFKNRFDNLEVLDCLNELLGKNINKLITSKIVRNKIIIIKIKSSVLRNELSYKKTNLINKINDKLGYDAVNDILFN